mmetsp:Transcript_18673/g.59316  ORF Transcript_18673/g.59316 Transcript_18673/m.59316 type:complete len:216 (+) Transcript_18673:1238-1885(+)
MRRSKQQPLPPSGEQMARLRLERRWRQPCEPRRRRWRRKPSAVRCQLAPPPSAALTAVWAARSPSGRQAGALLAAAKLGRACRRMGSSSPLSQRLPPLPAALCQMRCLPLLLGPPPKPVEGQQPHWQRRLLRCRHSCRRHPRGRRCMHRRCCQRVQRRRRPWPHVLQRVPTRPLAVRSPWHHPQHLVRRLQDHCPYAWTLGRHPRRQAARPAPGR